MAASKVAAGSWGASNKGQMVCAVVLRLLMAHDDKLLMFRPWLLLMLDGRIVKDAELGRAARK